MSASGAITARCTNGDAFRIALSSGSNGDAAARQMQRVGGGGAGGAVNDQLYTDSAETSAWGNGNSGTTMATGRVTANAVPIKVYGLVPAQSTPMPGNYSDTITATISF
ncbi:Csu type fimbrial protein [Paraburkholderia fynbosensis]|uniref:Spore coat protein U/FanG domain-containing protein n=1 Tax=Paraburkholderia fynbosensis TaxID=1200993 RepID=A0A6J5G9W9_9BURK|nr:spore coat U domain-containing protein [Paraburkholderia fynbosensis]CAB3794802.1 hypothetical protein LMG27177_03754 [Paraburkholderia fynbosensis]